MRVFSSCYALEWIQDPGPPAHRDCADQSITVHCMSVVCQTLDGVLKKQGEVPCLPEADHHMKRTDH